MPKLPISLQVGTCRMPSLQCRLNIILFLHNYNYQVLILTHPTIQLQNTLIIYGYTLIVFELRIMRV